MPPLGGAPLSPRDVAAVAAYVWAVGNAGSMRRAMIARLLFNPKVRES
jgi:hypothetical protein